MQSENRIFDDISKIINGAAGTLAGMSREFEGNARERAKEWIGGLDFVSREEFDAVKALAAQAREQVAVLEARLAALEAAAGGAAASAKPASAKSAAPKAKKTGE
jgi:BMFP domain-containing protein YqiC